MQKILKAYPQILEILNEEIEAKNCVKKQIRGNN
jgi:hypothetical protein